MNLKKLHTIAQIRIARQFRLGKPRKVLPRQLAPKAIARAYALELSSFILEKIKQVTAPLLAEIESIVNVTSRRDAGEGKRVQELVAETSKKLENAITPKVIEDLAEKFARRTADLNKTQLSRQVKAATGADVFINDAKLLNRIEGFSTENVSLIRGLSQETLSKIEKATTRAIQNATPHPTLAKELAETLDLAESRAKFIARDQIGKLYGQINADRQKAIGVEKFIWRTVKDERVRGEHDALDGEIFSYAEGGDPNEGLPGEAINCRCYAEPFFDDIMSEANEV